jgi:hypothetical protein
MKNLRFLFLIVLAFSFLPQQTQAQKKILLKYNVKTGDQYISHTIINQDIIMQAQGQSISMNQVITTDITTKIKAVSPDSTSTLNDIDKMTMEQTMFGQTLKYDSSDPTTFASGRSKLIGDALNKIIKKTYGITIDPLGNIIRYDLSKLLKEGGQVSGNVKSGNTYVVFPDHKVKVGDSWEADIKPMKTDNMKIHMKYTLTKLSGKKATIAIDGTIAANKLGNQNASLDGTIKGNAVVDEKTGWPVSSHMTQDINMKVEKNGMEIPMQISSTLNTTIEKK